MFVNRHGERQLPLKMVWSQSFRPIVVGQPSTCHDFSAGLAWLGVSAGWSRRGGWGGGRSSCPWLRGRAHAILHVTAVSPALVALCRLVNRARKPVKYQASQVGTVNKGICSILYGAQRSSTLVRRHIVTSHANTLSSSTPGIASLVARRPSTWPAAALRGCPRRPNNHGLLARVTSSMLALGGRPSTHALNFLFNL